MLHVIGIFHSKRASIVLDGITEGRAGDLSHHKLQKDTPWTTQRVDSGSMSRTNDCNDLRGSEVVQ